MTEIEALSKRVSALEEIARRMATHTTELKTIENARFQALWHIALEIVQHLGVSEDQYRKHFEALREKFRGQNLDQVEDAIPSLAAEIDKRSIEDVFVDEVPPLFPPQSSDSDDQS